MLNRFRWWLVKKLCPRMRLVIRIGKQITPKRFAAVKVYPYDIQIVPIQTIDIVRFRKATPVAGMQELIDLATVAEGSDALTLEDGEEEDRLVALRSKDEMQDLLKDALKGTGLEGIDEYLEPRKP